MELYNSSYISSLKGVHGIEFKDVKSEPPGDSHDGDSKNIDRFSFVPEDYEVLDDEQDDTSNNSQDLMNGEIDSKDFASLNDSQQNSSSRKRGRKPKPPHFDSEQKCPMCDYKSNVRVNFRAHMRRVHLNPKPPVILEEPYMCTLCDFKTHYSKKLMRHIATDHPGVKRERSYPRGERPRERQENHICSHCGKNFTEKRAFRQHELSHTGQYPFICPIVECGKGYITPGKMMDHIREHTGDEPYICQICAKAFTAKRKMLQHEKRYHKLTPRPHPSAVYGPREKKYKCDQCTMAFATSLNLEWHVEHVHKMGWTTKCEECGVEYKQMSALRRHMRERHENQKPYECQYCKKAFAQKAVMVGHERTHTGEKPFHCEDCPQKYSTRSALTNHRKKSHAKFSDGSSQWNGDARFEGSKSPTVSEGDLRDGADDEMVPGGGGLSSLYYNLQLYNRERNNEGV